ncbi:uncharacterized protein [Phaseolus vulgaris]|uniref:uncharacterized protein n=1 Tax=Phaseolus vulgaris TaxID=3885 RepID=UPI0035CBAE16
MKSCVFFKVDYEKAYDSVSWDFLYYMLERLGFCAQWIRWIKGCLESASVSVLVNGSPSREFTPGKGLRQGDPLAPFLFLIVAEGLARVSRMAEEKSLIDSLEVGRDKVKLPSVVAEKLDRIQRNFLWGWGSDGRKIAWASWKKVCEPRDYGGLDIINLRLFNLALLGAKVAELGNWIDGIWVWHFEWRRPFFEWEKPLVEQFFQLLQGVKLESGKADCWIWKAGGFHTFTVNSAYIQVRKDRVGEVSPNYSKLWRCKALPSALVTA